MKRALLIVVAAALAAVSSRAQESPAGLFRAEVTQGGGAVRHPESNSWEARVLDRDGAARYRISREVPFDIQFPSLRLSDEGWCVVASGNEGWVEWYDADGSMVRSLRPFASAAPDYERAVKTAVGRGRTALLLSDLDSPAATVMLTDASGVVLWSRTLAHSHAGEVAMSADGRFLLAGSYGSSPPFPMTTILFDGDGNEVWQREGMFRHAGISAAGDMVALAEKNAVRILPATPGGSASVWRTAGPAHVVSAVRWAGGFVAAAVEEVSTGSGVPRYVSSSLVLLDPSGAVVGRRTLRAVSDLPATLHPAGDGVELRSPTGVSVSIALPGSR